ncbi:unnamed protein product [Chrysoparadoxa australica]
MSDAGSTMPEQPSAGKDLSQRAKAVYDFSRPHTIRGTILASFTGVARALIEQPAAISLDLVPRAVLGLVALLLGNAFIVGINQIYDVDIDKVNKPFLPMAAGKMSQRFAWGVVVFSATMGPAIGLSPSRHLVMMSTKPNASCAALSLLSVFKNFSPLIIKLYMFGLTIGALYSVPPFQFKRIPILAGLTIACVRGFLLNFGVYYAVKEALGQSFSWNPAVIFLARFMTVFAGVIAVTKDLPDTEGDRFVSNCPTACSRMYNVSTFATRRGVSWTAKAASVVLGLNYVSAIVQGAISPAGSFNRKLMIGAHGAFILYLANSLRRLEADSKESIKAFYGRIWDLFYLEYAIYPFI